FKLQSRPVRAIDAGTGPSRRRSRARRTGSQSVACSLHGSRVRRCHRRSRCLVTGGADRFREEQVMDLVLWIAAGLLAAVALVGGISKTFVPKDRLAAVQGGGWTADASAAFVKTLGVLELLAAVGLVLPAVLGIAPVLVPVTALCWV